MGSLLDRFQAVKDGTDKAATTAREYNRANAALPLPPEADPRSPMMKQYTAVKAQHPDSLLLFRMGDFYEAFDADAELLAKTLGLTVTHRDGIVMAGFPYHSLNGYLAKLVKSGHRVAIAEATP